MSAAFLCNLQDGQIFVKVYVDVLHVYRDVTIEKYIKKYTFLRQCKMRFFIPKLPFLNVAYHPEQFYLTVNFRGSIPHTRKFP